MNRFIKALLVATTLVASVFAQTPAPMLKRSGRSWAPNTMVVIWSDHVLNRSRSPGGTPSIPAMTTAGSG